MRSVAAAIIAIGALGALAAVPGAERLFDDGEIVELTIEAPFNELFARAESQEDYQVTGRLTVSKGSSGREAIDEITIEERGHTSRRASECDFPKLKITFDPAPAEASLFAGMKAVKLGTHCGDSPDDRLTPKFGRLANEHAPLRETLSYQLLHAVGVPTLLARPARVTYVFSDDKTRPPLTRFAMLLEDDDEARRRMGGGAEIDEEEFGSAQGQFAPDDTVRLAFAQAMIGNFDWCLRMFPGDIYRCDDRHPLWNILAFTRPGGEVVPVMYDFDLSGPVVGRHVWFQHVFDASFVQPPSSIAVEVLAQVQRTRSLFTRRQLDETRARFLLARDAVQETIERAAADPAGKDFARQYVDAFYRAIEHDADFYRPIVIDGGYAASLDADGQQPVCGEWSLVPAGTPVGEPLEIRAGKQRVRLLDALWQWTGDRHCDAVHTGPVWIDSQAIGTEYPR